MAPSGVAWTGSGPNDAESSLFELSILRTGTVFINCKMVLDLDIVPVQFSTIHHFHFHGDP